MQRTAFVRNNQKINKKNEYLKNQCIQNKFDLWIKEKKKKNFHNPYIKILSKLFSLDNRCIF